MQLNEIFLISSIKKEQIGENMEFVSIQFNADEPIYLQLSQQIQMEIDRVKPPPGEKLPPIRKLALALGINNGTVVRAYKDLERKGFVYAKKGSGYEIIRHTDAIEALRFSVNHKVVSNLKHQDINFASATPDPKVFPVETFKACLNHVLDRDQGYAFEYQEGGGYPPLRESLCTYLKKEKGIDLNPSQIFVVSGAQQGLDLISKAYIHPEDIVLTEMPTYPGAAHVFASRGAKVIGVSLEQDGIKISELENYVAIHRPKIFYLMSRYQNPTACCYTRQKLKQILKLAEKYHFFIVEDDSLSELVYDKKSQEETADLLYGHSQVITIKSFSKLLMPGLRIGFLIAPETEQTLILQAKYVSDISSAGLLQRAVDIYFRSGQFWSHLEMMRANYFENYVTMKQALTIFKQKGISFNDSRGGLFFWVHFPDTVPVYELQKRCAAQGVRFISGHRFYHPGSMKNGLVNAARFSFAAVQTQEIETGIAMVQNCVEEILEERRKESYQLP